MSNPTRLVRSPLPLTQWTGASERANLVKNAGIENISTQFLPSLLECLPIFNNLTTTQLETALRVVERRDCAHESVLISEDQTSDTIFLLVEGSVKITARRGPEEVLLGLEGRGGILGDMSTIEGLARSANIVAQTSCIVGAISRHDFWNVLWEIPPIPYNVACILAERVRRLTAKVQAMASLDVRGRLAFQLVTLVQEHGQRNENGAYEIPFPLTQAELAQIVGTSRVQVNQLMTTWKRYGVVQTKRGSLSIYDVAALREMFPATLFTTPTPLTHSMNTP